MRDLSGILVASQAGSRRIIHVLDDQRLFINAPQRSWRAKLAAYE